MPGHGLFADGLSLSNPGNTENVARASFKIPLFTTFARFTSGKNEASSAKALSSISARSIFNCALDAAITNLHITSLLFRITPNARLMENPLNRRIQQRRMMKIGNLAIEPQMNCRIRRVNEPLKVAIKSIGRFRSRQSRDKLLRLLKRKRQHHSIRRPFSIGRSERPSAALARRNSLNPAANAELPAQRLQPPCSS